MSEPFILTEYPAGYKVNYCRTESKGMTEFHYQSTHIPNNKSFKKSLWCRNRCEFLSLLDHWNSMSENSWKYSSV